MITPDMPCSPFTYVRRFESALPASQLSSWGCGYETIRRERNGIDGSGTYRSNETCYETLCFHNNRWPKVRAPIRLPEACNKVRTATVQYLPELGCQPDGKCGRNYATNEPSRENARPAWPVSCALFTAAIEGIEQSQPATGRSTNGDQAAVVTRDATRPSRHSSSHDSRLPQDNYQNFVSNVRKSLQRS